MSRDADDHVFPRAAWLDWLTEHADGQFPEERLTRLVQVVDRLEEVGDVSELSACVAGSP